MTLHDRALLSPKGRSLFVSLCGAPLLSPLAHLIPTLTHSDVHRLASILPADSTSKPSRIYASDGVEAPRCARHRASQASQDLVRTSRSCQVVPTRLPRRCGHCTLTPRGSPSPSPPLLFALPPLPIWVFARARCPISVATMVAARPTANLSSAPHSARFQPHRCPLLGVPGS